MYTDPGTIAPGGFDVSDESGTVVEMEPKRIHPAEDTLTETEVSELPLMVVLVAEGNVAQYAGPLARVDNGI